MTLEQLRIFVAVAERRHFTQAAQDLCLTQSAVSAAIATLERNLAQPLFDRIGRRVELTRAGLVLLTEARAILRRADDAVRRLAELSDLLSGDLCLFGSNTVANYWLPPFMHRFRIDHPGVAVSLTIGNTEQALSAIQASATDLALVEGTVTDPSLIIGSVPGDRLVLVVGRNHPWFGQPRIDLESLVTTPWVSRELGSGTRRLFEDCLRRHGVDPDSLPAPLVLPSGEAIKRAVSAGAGAAVLSDRIVVHEIALGLLHAIPTPCPPRPLHLLHHPARHISRAAAAFAALVMKPIAPAIGHSKPGMVE